FGGIFYIPLVGSYSTFIKSSEQVPSEKTDISSEQIKMRKRINIFWQTLRRNGQRAHRIRPLQ
ncbi:MAG: hypothetical protein N2B00_02295, partial [Vibrio fluvialis]